MKLTVSITTYNHEKYIKQAIDSVLMQVVDFPYEILIGEDDSKDKTRCIVQDYQSRYPDRIRTFLNSRANVIYINGQPTGRWNFINNIKNARGNYIALLEGDDYWTDPNKLQKQVGYLDNHQAAAMCFHPAKWLDQSLGKILDFGRWPQVRKEQYDLDDLLANGNFIGTCSVMFRNKLITKFPEWFYSVPMGDFPLFILLACEGSIGYIDEPMSVYRAHKGGLWSTYPAEKSLQLTLAAYASIGRNLGLTSRRSYRFGQMTCHKKMWSYHLRVRDVKKLKLDFMNMYKTAPGIWKATVIWYSLLTLLPRKISWIKKELLKLLESLQY